jgi:hypothetical protein
MAYTFIMFEFICGVEPRGHCVHQRYVIDTLLGFCHGKKLHMQPLIMKTVHIVIQFT